MTYFNAENGIRKIFAAEILALLGGIAVTITAVLGIFALESSKIDSEAGATIFGIASIVLGIIGMVTLCIAYILNLAGILKAGNDEKSFIIAFGFVIVALIVSFVSAVFNSNQMIYSLCEAVIQICHLCITIFIITGIRHIATNLRRNDMERKGDNLFKIITFIYVLMIIARIVSVLFQNNLGTYIAVLIAIAAGVLEIVQYILYLSYLSKAKKMLAEANSK